MAQQDNKSGVSRDEFCSLRDDVKELQKVYQLISKQTLAILNISGYLKIT